MKPYRDVSGNSGVEFYEYGEDWIKVRFRHGDTYLYDHRSTGSNHVEHMKDLADEGRGLSAYISQHVRHAYASKER